MSLRDFLFDMRKRIFVQPAPKQSRVRGKLRALQLEERCLLDAGFFAAVAGALNVDVLVESEAHAAASPSGESLSSMAHAGHGDVSSSDFSHPENSVAQLSALLFRTDVPATPVVNDLLEGPHSQLVSDSGRIFAAEEDNTAIVDSQAPAAKAAHAAVDDVRDSAAREIVFIDSRVEDVDTLLAAVRDGVTTVVLDADADGLTQMVENLASESRSSSTGFSAIHVVSHGSSGQLLLGNSVVSSDSVDLYSQQFDEIRRALTTDGDLLFYGCSVGAGESGGQFLASISELTEADVAASVDVTGADSLGGNWTLESATGPVDAQVVFTATARTDYEFVLGTSQYSFSDSEYSIAEGQAATATTIAVTRSDTSLEESLDIVLSDGSALAGSDYTAGPVTVTFGAGVATQFISIPVIDDSVVELDESLSLSMTNFSAGGSVGATNATATLKLINDDSATIVVAAGSAPESSGIVTLTATLTGSVDTAFTVSYSSADVGAVAGTDYTAVSGLFAFDGNSGDTDSVSVTVTDDSVVEYDEAFAIQLTEVNAGGRQAAGSGGITTVDGTATITNDDMALLSVRDVSISESDGTASFVITSTHASQHDLTVAFDTVDDSARAPEDYAAISNGQVTFSAGGSLTQRVDVSVFDNTTVESDEVFRLQLVGAKFDGTSDPSRVMIDDGRATATILNDDTPVLAQLNGAGDLLITDETTAGASFDLKLFVDDQNDTDPSNDEIVIDSASASLGDGSFPGVKQLRFLNSNVTGRIVINGGLGNDIVTLDYSGGNFSASAIEFHGGTQLALGSDGLAVIGSGSSVATYTPDVSTFGNGVVDVDGMAILFTGLEPVDITGMATATLNLPGSDDTLTVVNGTDFFSGGTNDALRVSGSSGGVNIETVAFWNNDNLIINTIAADGNDSISISSADNIHGNVNLRVATGTGSDVISISGDVTTRGTQTYDGAITLGADVALSGSTVINESTISGGGNGLTITGNADIDGSIIGVSSLTVTGASAVSINANVIVTGDVDISSSDDIFIAAGVEVRANSDGIGGGTLVITADDATDADGAGDLSASTTSTLRGHTVNLGGFNVATGEVRADLGDVTVTANNEIRLNGNVTAATAQVTATATADDLHISANVGAGTSVNLEATTGRVLQSAGTDISAGTDVFIDAAVSVNLEGTTGNGTPVGMGVFLATAIDTPNVRVEGTITANGEVIIGSQSLAGAIRFGPNAAITANNDGSGTDDINIRADGAVTQAIGSSLLTRTGDIVIVSDAGDIMLDRVTAADGAITVRATAGSINDADDGTDVNLTAGTTINLTAQDEIGGATGTSSSDMDGRLEVAAGSDVRAASTSAGDIVIGGPGALILTNVSTANGAVNVLAGGTVVATHVTSVTDDDSNDIMLRTVTGNLIVGTISAGDFADVTLSSSASVLDDGDPGTMITADVLSVDAMGRISLDTSVAILSVTSTDAGDIAIRESNGLEIHELSQAAAGNIRLTSSTGTVTVTAAQRGVSSSVSGTILLRALGGSDGNIVIDGAVTGTVDTISLLADNDIRFGEDATVGSATGDVLITADNDALGGGSITMTDGSQVVSVSGDISLLSDQNIALASLSTSAEVRVTSLTADITDSGDAHQDIVAGHAALRSATGIGHAGALETTLSNLAFRNTASGDVAIENTGSLVISENDGLANSVNPGGSILLRTTDSLTFDADVSAGTDLTACVLSGDITLNAELDVSDTVRLQSGDGRVLQNSSGMITTTDLGVSASASIDLDGTVNDISNVFAAESTASGFIDFANQSGMTVGSVPASACFSQIPGVSTTNGSIRLTTGAGDLVGMEAITAGGTGDIVLATTTSGNVYVNSVTADGNAVSINAAAGGAILEYGSDGTADIAGATIELMADFGIGDTAELEIDAVALAATTMAGSIRLLDTSSGITIDAVGATTGVSITSGSTSDDIILRSAGTMTVDAPVTNAAGGNILLTVEEADADINANAPVSSAGGHLTLTSDDDIALNSNVTTLATRTISVFASNRVVEGTAVDGIIMAADASVSTAGGNIHLSSIGEGDVVLGFVSAGTGDVSIESERSVHSNVNALNVAARSLRIVSDSNNDQSGTIGMPDMPVRTAVTTLAATSADGLFVQEADDLLIGDTADIQIERVLVDGTTSVITNNSITNLTTTDSGNMNVDAGGSLTTEAGVTVVATGGDISLSAGDTLRILGDVKSVVSPNLTTLSLSATAGQAILHVVSTSGYEPGQTIALKGDDASTELFTVTGVSGATLTLSDSLVGNFSATNASVERFKAAAIHLSGSDVAVGVDDRSIVPREFDVTITTDDNSAANASIEDYDPSTPFPVDDRIEILADNPATLTASDGTVTFADSITLRTDGGVALQLTPRPAVGMLSTAFFVFETDPLPTVIDNAPGFFAGQATSLNAFEVEIGVAGEENLQVDVDWQDPADETAVLTDSDLQSQAQGFGIDNVLSSERVQRFLIASGGTVNQLGHLYSSTDLVLFQTIQNRTVIEVDFSVSHHESISVLGASIVRNGIFELVSGGVLTSTDDASTVDDSVTAVAGVPPGPVFENGTAIFTIPTTVPPPGLFVVTAPVNVGAPVQFAPPETTTVFETNAIQEFGGGVVSDSAIGTDVYLQIRRQYELDTEPEIVLRSIRGDDADFISSRLRFEEFVSRNPDLTDGAGYEVWLITETGGQRVERPIVKFEITGGRPGPATEELPETFEPYRLRELEFEQPTEEPPEPPLPERDDMSATAPADLSNDIASGSNDNTLQSSESVTIGGQDRENGAVEVGTAVGAVALSLTRAGRWKRKVKARTRLSRSARTIRGMRQNGQLR